MRPGELSIRAAAGIGSGSTFPETSRQSPRRVDRCRVRGVSPRHRSSPSATNAAGPCVPQVSEPRSQAPMFSAQKFAAWMPTRGSQRLR